ncbi:MAG: exodeoxyribonuclease VII large subunit [Oscillospiraceae bacterium]|jgi:exodeoxyribonuclease VII large subunit|nr:exodeoxyribonuclease VII large subunit [Oscillospiraceae bacterium]
MENAVLSVTELNHYIKNLMDGDMLLAGLAVRGEISNYKLYPSGHHYFTLKDSESALRCVLFKGSASRLRFRPENGIGVTAVGRVTVFPRDGAYQLYCTELLPEGMGDLHLAYEQLKDKLSKEGLFDVSRKKPLPRCPQTIALVTSSAGAAVRDMIRVLGKRWPMAKLVILPVRVQGAEAPPEIAGAIRYANRYRVAELIITGRGGGSIEDLWAFNDERVARAIFESELPVISAVGHEPDVTIADYAADLRAATPSNAAELAVPDAGELREVFSSAEARLLQAVRKKLSEKRARLGDLSARRVMRNPTAYIDQKRLELDRAQTLLTARFERLAAAKKHGYIRLAAALDALSPLKVLARGYSIITDADGRTVSDAEAVSVGNKLRLTLNRGALGCTVDNIVRER